MAINIHRILGKSESYSICELGIGAEKMVAKVWDGDDSLKKVDSETDVWVELDYGKLKAITVMGNFDDEDFVIAAKDDRFILKGKVSGVVKMENDSLIDIYLRPIADFILILKSEIGDLQLEEGQGVEVEVTDLRFYPTNV